MKTSNFNFHLPEHLLAEHPSEHRDEAKLMVLNRKDQTIEHKLFKDVIDYFDDGDLFIFNNTKVFPARLYGNKEKTGARIEVFLLRELDRETRVWDVLVDPARKIRIGNKLFFTEDESLVAEVIDNTTSRGRTLRFLFDGSYEEFRQKLKELGETPLPKYIKRAVEPEDGINFAEVTLHVGLGTFNPIEVEDISKHKMECEEAIIDEKNAEIINKAVEENRRICCVGTTTMRALETSVSSNKRVSAYHGWTNKFIYPPYEFGVANAMITNFHTPKSTLLMMIAAFAGKDFVMHAYEEAIKNEYKFYSYGDAMLII